MHLLQPSIYPGGFEIREPVTALTDLIISAVCIYACIRLMNLPGKTRTGRYYVAYFALMAGATTLGGLLGHAFAYAVPHSWKFAGWLLSMLSVATIERTAIQHARSLFKPFVGDILMILNVIELTAAMLMSFHTMDFMWVVIHSTFGLLAVVTPLHLIIYFKTKCPGSLTTISAVGVCAASAIVFLNNVSIGPMFNNKDIAHIILAIGAWTFMKGAVKIGNLNMAVA